MPKTADEVIAEFEKKHGLKIGKPDKVAALSTGNLAIDAITGIGGIPLGRITELYGLEASGKTTTALQTIVGLQRDIIARDCDEKILYLDFEHALDADYATSLGIDLDHPSLILAQPDWLEQGAEAALDLVETGVIRLIVFDSVAAMAPKRLKEGSFDQATMAMHRAKLMSGLLQVLTGQLHHHRCAAVFINHKMESVDMSGRPGLPAKVTTPGGRGLKYYASLRLEFNQIGQVKGEVFDTVQNTDANQIVAYKISVKCVKNKLGPPNFSAEVRSRFGKGFDNAWSALQILEARKVTSSSGAWTYFDPKKCPELLHDDMSVSNTGRGQVQGEAQLLRFADEYPEWRTALITRAQRELAGAVETL